MGQGKKPSRLDERPFSFQPTKDGRVLISHEGRQIMILKGPEAGRFLRRAQGACEDDLQLLLAKVTKNFKRGNERR
jgi:hypothetical protein